MDPGIDLSATQSYMLTAILGALVCIIIYYIFDWIKEFIWDILTVSVKFSGTSNDPTCNEVDCDRLLAYIVKLTKLTQKKPRDKLFGYWSHIVPRIRQVRLQNGQYKTKVKAGPESGTSFFTYQGCWVRLVHSTAHKVKTNRGETAGNLKLSTWRWNGEILKSLILEAIHIKIVPVEEVHTTTVYGIYDGKWVPLGYPKPVRSLSSVFLTKGQVESIIEDVQGFLNSKNWYEERCIPHHRGYLLYGPPGCGKTSMIRAVAGQFKYGICSLSLSTKGLSDDALVRYLNSTPYRTLILLEDIDCTFKSREDVGASSSETNVVLAGSSGSLVTFRGLLNALDGVASCDGKIVFLTTNYPERLDPALTRPGRVDMEILLDYPNEDQIGRYFERFYPEATPELKRRFLDSFKGLKNVSMAMVLGVFMMYKTNVEECVANAGKYFDEKFATTKTIKN